ncbi:MAG: SprT-like domain-containing protein [Candidatus Eremiobacteraeota bacterium]|nr:SprT-like domain-containing protein [Candidatus Eremiobacteraeota bacterium]MBC5828131.1 SprT-like domain-containing protein [Candidatus Eremiobacteraeota bacterium]
MSITAVALESASPLPCESDLQLLFSALNVAHFGGMLPGYRIVYNARLTSVAGRIAYKPPLIELSSSLLAAHPDHVEATMLHEMVHAWLHLNRLPSGHGMQFKRKMREVGLGSIYHSMPVGSRRSRRRYVLSCPRCKVELLRRQRPGSAVSCARCSPSRFNRRVQMAVREL